MVIASPPHAPSVADIVGSTRIWGVWTSLYGQRSERNAGVGDFEDLARIAEELAGSGAAFAGVNPVHSRGIAETGISPYAPSSRTALDAGHIAFDKIPEFAVSPCARELSDSAGSMMSQARDATAIDYVQHKKMTIEILRALFETFEIDADSTRRSEFEIWRSGRSGASPAPGSSSASRQACFEALSECFGSDWRSWPEPYRTFESDAVRDFITGNARAIRFFEWCEWIAESQLSAAQARATAAGMPVGLYLDIAVGVRPGGAETWATPDVFAKGVSLGAPPDLLNAQGQAWNLAGFSPFGLKENEYRPFREMLRNTMAHAGMVRIDHIIGLRRSFWLPENGAPGGYVSFPSEILMALVRIEAQRANCLVVGEDLGTVPEGLRENMEDSGLYGCSIMAFERSHDGFLPPGQYRRQSLASFGTHDLPPLAGWWQGEDIETRSSLGHLAGEAIDRAWSERHRDRVGFCRRLAEAGLLPDGIDPEAPPDRLDEALRDAMHAILAGSAADLVALGLDDIFGLIDQQNVPGTVDEAPNWRRRAPVTIEELADTPELKRAASIMNTGRRP